MAPPVLKRICIVSRHNLSANTRVARQARSLADAGHEVTVAAVRCPATRDARIRYVEIPLWTQRRFALARRLRRTSATERGRLEAGGPGFGGTAEYAATSSFAAGVRSALAGSGFEAVQAHDTRSLPAAAALAGREGAVLVLDAVEITEHRQTEGSRGLLDRTGSRLERRREERLLRRVDRVLTVGNSVADWYAGRYGIERPLPVRNARERAALERNELIRGDCGLAPGDSLVVWIGSMKPYQGIDSIMDAAPLLPAHVHFALLGGAAPRWSAFADETRREVSARGLDGRIHILGERDPDELVEYVSSADLGIIPLRPVTLNVELSLPNKLFELIAARLPVVATRDLVEVAETIERYGIGETFDVSSPEDVARAITAVLADERYREAAARAADELTWEREAEEYVTLFED